jgi:hypothetical protein
MVEYKNTQKRGCCCRRSRENKQLLLHETNLLAFVSLPTRQSSTSSYSRINPTRKQWTKGWGTVSSYFPFEKKKRSHKKWLNCFITFASRFSVWQSLAEWTYQRRRVSNSQRGGGEVYGIKGREGRHGRFSRRQINAAFPFFFSFSIYKRRGVSGSSHGAWIVVDVILLPGVVDSLSVSFNFFFDGLRDYCVMKSRRRVLCSLKICTSLSLCYLVRIGHAAYWPYLGRRVSYVQTQKASLNKAIKLPEFRM